MINWGRMRGSSGFLLGMIAGGIICRNGWAGINWWVIGTGLASGLVYTLVRPWWEHRQEWSEIIWGRRR